MLFLQVPPKTATDSNAITHIMAELPVLSSMMTQLFESSQHLDEESLHCMIDALCQMSQEAMELAYSNRVSHETSFDHKQESGTFSQ